jgi:c(7)-type cytochrome triheme protein
MKVLFIAVAFICLMTESALQAKSVGGGDIIFTPKNPGVKQVLFSHENHVTGKNIKCSGCHYRIFQMAKGSYKMNMDKITEGEFCGKCHDGRIAFDVKDKKNCKRCHV